MAKKRRADSGAAGILLVDKPEGPTSFDVVAKLRSALGTRAIGHAGTLDPLASGLLVVLVGPYTRLSQHLTAADKAYEALITFGSRTTTDDREGDVVEEGDPSGIDDDVLRRALASMLGEQDQVPPAYAAISVEGERLYARARRGEQVEAPPRRITIHELTLERFSPPSAVVRVVCSKGTYVRAIARDLGSRLGVPAHLGGLRRTISGDYRVEDALGLAELLEEGRAQEALLRGPAAIRGVPLVEISEEDARALEQGRGIPRPPSVGGAPDGSVLVAHAGDALVAIVQARGGELRPSRGLGRC